MFISRLQIKKRRTQRIARGETAQDEDDLDGEDDGSHKGTLMMRILGPIVTFVDRPWKMYPVGVLFGFGKCPSQSRFQSHFPYPSLLPDDAHGR